MLVRVFCPDQAAFLLTLLLPLLSIVDLNSVREEMARLVMMSPAGIAPMAGFLPREPAALSAPLRCVGRNIEREAFARDKREELARH